MDNKIPVYPKNQEPAKNTDPYFWTKKNSDEEYRNMRAEMFDKYGYV